MKSKPLRILDEALTEHEKQYDDLFLHSVAKAERYRVEILKGLNAITVRPTGYGYVFGQTFRSYGPTKKEKYRIAYVEMKDEIIGPQAWHIAFRIEAFQRVIEIVRQKNLLDPRSLQYVFFPRRLTHDALGGVA